MFACWLGVIFLISGLSRISESVKNETMRERKSSFLLIYAHRID